MATMTMPVVMTPYVATPTVFQQAAPPWVTQTPESSPMPWGCFPRNEGYMLPPSMPMEKGASKEFLRSICEPFFDQMLMAVQQALQAQSQEASQMQVWQQVPPASCQGFETLLTSRQGPGQPSEDASTEEGSDMVSDGDAFASILTPHSGFDNEEESRKSRQLASKSSGDAQTKTSDGSEDVEVQSSEGADAQYEELVSEPPQGGELGKNAMVCRHWKSKGYCRMEDKCKFLHPDHKRGVGTAGGIKGDGSTDMNKGLVVNSLVLTSSPSDQLTVSAMDAKKKDKKKRKSKGKSGALKEDMSAPNQLVDVQLASNASSGSYVHPSWHSLMLGSTA